MGVVCSIFFRFLAGTFDGSPPATRRRGGYSETLAGGQLGPARAAPPATFGVATRGSGSCGGCGSGGQPQRAAPGKQHVTWHNNSSSTWGGPKVTKAKRVGEARVIHSARKLSCIVLCIVRGNRRRGQWQGDQRAGGETNNNKKSPQNGTTRTGRRSSGDGLPRKMLCTVRARTEGRRRTGGEGQGARRQDPEQPGTEVERRRGGQGRVCHV